MERPEADTCDWCIDGKRECLACTLFHGTCVRCDELYDFYRRAEQKWESIQTHKSQFRKVLGLVPPPNMSRGSSMLDREAIISRVDMRVLAEQYGCSVRRAGSGYSAKCLFHDDHSPSMSLNDQKKQWYCHAEGRGGSAIDFVMEAESISFREALTKLDSMFR